MVPSLLGHINRTSMHTLFMNILHRIMNIGNITFEKDKKTNIMEIRKKKKHNRNSISKIGIVKSSSVIQRNSLTGHVESETRNIG